MMTHKQVFKLYATHYKPDGIDWLDALGYLNLEQCEVCRKYGNYGDEVQVLDEGPSVCEGCQVEVWGWTTEETGQMYLETFIPADRVDDEEYIKDSLKLNAKLAHGKVVEIKSWGVAK